MIYSNLTVDRKRHKSCVCSRVRPILLFTLVSLSRSERPKTLSFRLDYWYLLPSLSPFLTPTYLPIYHPIYVPNHLLTYLPTHLSTYLHTKSTYLRTNSPTHLLTHLPT